MSDERRVVHIGAQSRVVDSVVADEIERLRAEVEPLKVSNMTLRTKLEQCRAEVADATKWNHSVRVCKDHTTDIVDGECVICELAEKDKRIEELEKVVSE